jgi:hypothetical protein
MVPPVTAIADELCVARLLNVPTAALVSPGAEVTPAFRADPERVPAAAVTVILEVPSNVTPFIVRPVCSAVAVLAFPVRLPVTIPVILPVRLPVTLPVNGPKKTPVKLPAVYVPLAIPIPDMSIDAGNDKVTLPPTVKEFIWLGVPETEKPELELKGTHCPSPRRKVSDDGLPLPNIAPGKMADPLTTEAFTVMVPSIVGLWI